MRIIFFNIATFLIAFYTNNIFAQNNLIEKFLKDNPDKFENVLEHIDSHEVQIIYTQINRDKNNFPSFKTYKYRVNPKEYFYPASTIKFPLAVLSLEKLNNLKIKGLNKFTPFKIDSAVTKTTSVCFDTSSSDGLASIGHQIKKLFLVSDNNAYNYLYEFLGQKEINNTLHKKGYKEAKIVHRFVGGLSVEENRKTNGIQFFNDEKIIYQQFPKSNNETYSFKLNNEIKGIGYLNSKDSLINKPFDFTSKNFISLETITNILIAVLFPNAVNAKMRFNLSKDDLHFLYKYMSMLPRESKKPGYDSTYYDSYVKYFLFGDSKKSLDGNIRIFNKVGLAYGYLTDVAYIVDFENKVEFMLSATIHVNKNQIYNDGVYEYDKIGLPFLANLGRVIYDFEKTRVKKFLPNLEKFMLKYQ